MRAVAVLLVVLYHADLPVPGGFTGVDVFFVISGFVITGMLLTEHQTTGRLDFAAFYSRRVRRILPALALMISVVAILSTLGVSSLEPKQLTAKTGIAASLFSANIFLFSNPRGYFGVEPGANPFLHTWSLSVEEQFYLVFPMLLAVAWWAGRRFVPNLSRRVLAATVIGIGGATSRVLSIALSSASTQGIGPAFGPRFAFYMAPTRAWEFAAGALLAVGASTLARVPERIALTLGVFGTALVVFGAFAITETTPFPGTAALIPVAGTALLIAAGCATNRGISAVLSVGPMQRLGDISYGWYLWHWPLVVFSLAIWPGDDRLAVAAAAASILPAYWSYRYLEQPIRHNRAIAGWRALRLAGACIMIPLVLCLGLSQISLPGASAATEARLAALSGSHGDEIRHCNRGLLVGPAVARCTWSVEHPRGTIVLVGDSNAGQFTEPAARAANELGYDLIVATNHGCRFSAVVVVRSGRADPACYETVLNAIPALIDLEPQLVLMASSSPEMLGPSSITLRDPQTGQSATMTEEKVRLWTVGVTRVLEPLAEAGIPSVVINTIPHYPLWRPNCAAIRAYFDPSSCGATLRRADVDAYRKDSIAADLRAAAAVPGTTTIDFADQLCSASVCRTNDGDHWNYRDAYHLSNDGALDLTDEFVALIRAALAGPPPHPESGRETNTSL